MGNGSLARTGVPRPANSFGLHKVFRKLDLSTRKELRRVLADSPDHVAVGSA
jgi:hypothetical protein